MQKQFAVLVALIMLFSTAFAEAGCACYGTDPNCTSTGGYKGCCGNGVCEAGETIYNCPTDNCSGYY